VPRAVARCVVCLAATCAVLPAAAQAPSSGISGSVTVSPVRPGPQRAGDAESAPFAGARVELRSARGALLAAASTDAAGRFRLAAPPGEYDIVVRPRDGGILPRCEDAHASVRVGETTDVAIACDSGMR